MAEPTYVYDKKEYKKTGRTATQKIQRTTKEIVKELVEIRPVNVPDENTEFDKWVDPKDLFEVTGN
jgi:hypothetical protein